MSAELNNKYSSVINDKLVTFTSIGVINLPPFSKVTSVCVIPFTKEGKIVAVRLKNRGLDLPGGHVEKYEKTPEETLHREVMEEAYITIKKPVLVEIIESDYFGPNPHEASYMLIYAAFVNEILDYRSTDEMSYERVITDKSSFIDEYNAGDKKMMGDAINRAETIMLDSKPKH